VRLPSGLVNAETTPELTDDPRPSDWYADHVGADADRFARVLADGLLDTEVPACPGMDIADVAVHLGVVYQWAARCMLDGTPPDGMGQFTPDPGSDLAVWFRGVADEVTAAMRQLDPDGPTWHPFPVDRVGRVWPRRMAHESTMHRWDVQHAVGATTPIDATLASDGIDEYFELVVPRRFKRDEVPLPAGSLHVHCTDVDGEWFVSADDGYHIIREHRKGDAVMRGPAAALLLRLWGRDGDRSELDFLGDEAVLDAWLDVAGM